jgi:lipopolysaccharide biosynthesis glycosyltransferase
VSEHGVYGSFKSYTSAESLSSTSSEKDDKRKRFKDKFMDMMKKEEKPFQDGPVFGVSMENLQFDEGVPKIVSECVKVINKEENAKTHGIYRTSGNKMVIENLKKWIDDKKSPKKYEILKEQSDIHCVTGVLKLFIRELKYPLIPYEVLVNFSKNNGE